MKSLLAIYPEEMGDVRCQKAFDFGFFRGFNRGGEEAERRFDGEGEVIDTTEQH